jgi:hypothetical protein
VYSFVVDVHFFFNAARGRGLFAAGFSLSSVEEAAIFQKSLKDFSEAGRGSELGAPTSVSVSLHIATRRQRCRRSQSAASSDLSGHNCPAGARLGVETAGSG